jgi:Outer membrane protein beta-barrel domain
MKVLLTFVISLSTAFLFGQSGKYAGVNAGYMFNGKVQFVEGVVDIGNAPSVNVSLGYKSDSYFGVELNYTSAVSTDLNFRANSQSGFLNFNETVDIHHICLNYKNYFWNDSKIHPFLEVGGGISIFNIRTEDIKDPIRLNLDVGCGVFIALTKRLSLHAKVTFLAPIVFEGVGIHAGIGTGGSNIGLSLNASAPLAQLNSGVGLVWYFSKQD